MANTPIEAIYTSLKTKYEPTTYAVRYPYVFDQASIPYLYMYEVDDVRNKSFMCDDRGGVARITVGILSKSFEEAVDGLEAVIAYVRDLVGNYTPVNAWKIDIDSVRDLTGIEQSDTKVYRREFDALITWSA